MLLFVSKAVKYIGGLINEDPGASDDFLGNWDALTNTPAIADGSADDDQYYTVSVAGTQDLGSGPIVFEVNDIVRQEAGVWVNKGPAPQVQTDWNENDPSDPAFLVNRPTSLTNGDNADTLHKHSIIQNAGGNVAVQAISTVISMFTGAVERFRVLASGDLQAFNYPQTRNDVTVNDEKVLTTDASGNLLLRRVLPFSSIVSTIVGKLNQSTTLLTYHTHAVVIPEDGLYTFTGKYIWSYNAGGQNFVSRVLLDGATVLAEQLQNPPNVGGAGVLLEDLANPGNFVDSGTSQRYPAPIFEAVFLTAGAHTFELQIAGTSADDEPSVYNCVTRVKREA